MSKGLIQIIILLIAFNVTVLAQRHPDSLKRAVISTKPLTGADSTMVTQIFFSALREKTIENYTLAAEYFNRVIKVDPGNDAALYELGKIRLAENNESSARDLFEKAVALKPDNKYYWLALAECYEKNNDVTKLENVFNQLLKLDPDNEEYLFNKANVLMVEKKYDEALVVYNRLEQSLGLTDNILAGRQKIYMKLGKLDLAVKEMTEMISTHPDQIKYYLLLAELYNASNLNDKALEVLQKAEKMDGKNPIVELALADIYKNKNDFQLSFDHIKMAFSAPELNINEAIRIIFGYFPKFPDPNAKASALDLSKELTISHPGDARAYAMYGNMLVQNGAYKEAKPQFKKSLAINSQVYEVWEQLVRIEIGNGEYDEAVTDGEDALSYFPNQAWLNYLVGVAWQQKKNYSKAIDYAENVTALETQDKSLLSQCYSLIGDSYHGMNNFPRSDEAYDKALQYDKDNVYTLNNYAYYLSVRGEQLDKAALMSAHAIEKQPNTSSFEDTYAWILFKQKKYTEARTWIEKALADDKTNSAVQIEHYGDILFYLGDVDAALINWKKAKQLGNQSALLNRKINEKKYVE